MHDEKKIIATANTTYTKTILKVNNETRGQSKTIC